MIPPQPEFVTVFFFLSETTRPLVWFEVHRSTRIHQQNSCVCVLLSFVKENLVFFKASESKTFLRIILRQDAKQLYISLEFRKSCFALRMTA